MQDTNVNNFLHQKAKNKLVYLLRTVVTIPRALDSVLGKKKGTLVRNVDVLTNT